MKFQGYVVAETPAAIAVVRAADALVKDIKPLWLPRKKIESLVETDQRSVEVNTAQGRKQGIPHEIDFCDKFATRVGW